MVLDEKSFQEYLVNAVLLKGVFFILHFSIYTLDANMNVTVYSVDTTLYTTLICGSS